MRRRPDGTLIFSGYPEFRPNLSPREMFALGIFGGTYFRPISSAVTGKNYRNRHRKYTFLRGIAEDMIASPTCDVRRNYYRVHSGTSLEYWENHGWISPQDPYGWVQWYCEFYSGRRSADDARQIARWAAFAGPNGRFLRRVVNMIKSARARYNDPKISPVIRQGLLHWGKIITKNDVTL
jgi:hypothetical protein